MVQPPLAITLDSLVANFPYAAHPHMRPVQKQALELIAGKTGSVTLEAPTGSGKTAIGRAFLETVAEHADGPVFYIVPNKTQVDQVKSLYPDLTAVYGRGEYDCLYYEEPFRANEIPCLSLTDCSHRVNINTGHKHLDEPAVAPCPYYQAKFQAKQSRIVVCTTAFYLYTHLFSREYERPAGLVVDEAHRIASTIRGALAYDISDWHLHRSIGLLYRVGAASEAEGLQAFLDAMVRILHRKSPHKPTLLEQAELDELLQYVSRLNPDAVRRAVGKALLHKSIDPVAEQAALKQLETVAFDLSRYVRSLEYALPGENRAPLNYVTYAYSYRRPQGQQQVQHRLIVRAYYVAPIVKRLLSRNTLAYSATIGDPRIFGFETGITAPFHALPGTFPPEHSRIFMPSDTPDLASRRKSHAEPTKVLRRVAKQCRDLADSGLRSLVVVVSEQERNKFLRLCLEEGVTATSYNDTETPRAAMNQFKQGQGDVLVGTTANYGEGIDLPGGLAPVTFFLRPGYPSPADPATQFEVQRFGKGQAWAVWNWRVMVEALQVRGRNVRSIDDRGVTIFVSQQFRRFVYASLPEWMKPSYRSALTLEQCIAETETLLTGQSPVPAASAS
jgi:Rad3-related DNA helicase